MKRLLTILCLICFAQASYAALDRNYFEYDLTPSGAYSEEDANVKTETKTITEDGGQVKTKIERKRKRGFRGTVRRRRE